MKLPLVQHLIQLRQKKVEENTFSLDYLSKFWIPLGAVLIAAITLFSANYKIPAWAIYLFAVYLTSIIIAISWRPLKKFYLSARKNRKFEIFAKANYHLLFEYTENLSNMIDCNRLNTMGRLLKDLLTYFSALPIEEINKDWYHNSEIVYNLKEWHLSVLKQIQYRRQKDFICLAEYLEISIKQFHRVCLNTRSGLEKVILKDGIGEREKIYRLKTDWNTTLGDYTDFMRRWQKFAKDMNKKLEKTILLEYFEPLKPL